MQLDTVWFAVEQVRRILQSIGWTITAQDTSGPDVIITIKKSKAEIIPK